MFTITHYKKFANLNIILRIRFYNRLGQNCGNKKVVTFYRHNFGKHNYGINKYNAAPMIPPTIGPTIGTQL